MTSSMMTPRTRYIICFTVMLVTIIEVLDMTIVNVALPSMMGSLGANAEEITWVLTSYIVASAILMPLTGLLIERIGQKNLLIANIIGFLISSMLCGMANTLPQLVIARLAQGAFGASLVPLSQFIIRNIFPMNEQSKAMAIWGIGVMTAPVMGPTIGGFITELLNWRWVFYINLPICLLALILSVKYIKHTERMNTPIDWLGLCLLSAAIGCFQIFLDEGNSHDWFSSSFICMILITSIVSTLCFIVHAATYHQPIIRVSVFRNKNFSIAVIGMLGFMISVFGVISTQPMILEQLMHYSIIQAGMIMAPRGIASAIAMIMVSKINRPLALKKCIVAGLLLSFISNFWMSQFTLMTPKLTIITSCFIQGFGTGLFFIPMSTFALLTLRKEQVGAGTGIFSLGRSLGSSIGISVTSAFVTYQSQLHWHDKIPHITKTAPLLMNALQAHGMSLEQKSSLALIAGKIIKQSQFLAFIDAYYLSSFMFLLLIPLILCFDLVENES